MLGNPISDFVEILIRLWIYPNALCCFNNLREFVKLPSSWPPARVGGGSDLKLLTPDPRDPVVSSKNVVLAANNNKR